MIAMKALRSWRNMEHEGDVQIGRMFTATEQRARELELHGLALRDDGSWSSSVLIQGMHGLGDNIYQRAVVRQFMERRDEVWLETPWPAIYHDMPELRLVDPKTSLRTQSKNVVREGDRYERSPPKFFDKIKIWYNTNDIQKHGSLPNAMLGQAGCRISGADYRLPVPQEWKDRARSIIGFKRKPILVYRPLTARHEWQASAQRNPDPEAYAQIIASIRARFFVISIADVEDGKEWFVGPQIKCDLEFHKGELDVEVLTGLFSLADLVFASPGFALAMAQAVEVPCVTVFGGHEDSRSYLQSAQFAPFLGIDPIDSCNCFNSNHKCDKRIDIVRAKDRVQKFLRWL